MTDPSKISLTVTFLSLSRTEAIDIGTKDMLNIVIELEVADPKFANEPINDVTHAVSRGWMSVVKMIPPSFDDPMAISLQEPLRR
jgi:hypothetical protein